MARKFFELVDADDIEPDLEAGLVDGLLARKAVSVFYGSSSAGKTFVVVDLSCRIASGQPWYGMEVEPGLVIYVAAENPRSVEHRVWAWMRHHKVEHLPLIVVKSPINFNDGDAIDLAMQLREAELDPVLIVVDTLARAMVGDENTSEGMGPFIRACDLLRDAFDCHVLIVHHTGKDQHRGARGHSSLRAAVDTEVELEKDKGSLQGSFLISKARDGKLEGSIYGYELQDVELGKNSKDRTITTAVSTPFNLPTDAKAPGSKLTDNQQVVLDIFEELAGGRNGMVPVELWRERALTTLPQERRRQVFDRAFTALVRLGKVVVRDDVAMTFTASLR